MASPFQVPILTDIQHVVNNTTTNKEMETIRYRLTLRTICKSRKNKNYEYERLDNTDTMKANATRWSVYTIHKYTPTNTSNTSQIKQKLQT